MDKISQLEAEYCPPLDTALFQAIVSDYDLSTNAGIVGAVAVLDPLKESAALEEAAAGFDPSGVGNGHPHDREDQDFRHGQSLLSSDGLQSTETDTTSVFDELSSLRLSDSSPNVQSEQQDLNSLDDSTKRQLLHDIFREQVSNHTIESSLRKCNGDWNATIEELLTQVFYEEAEDSDGNGKLVPKGIDGFSEDRVSRSAKRKRNRRQRVSTSAHSTASDASDISLDSQSSGPSKWLSAQSDVDFIASHTQLPISKVRVKYNQQGASVPQTINALLKEEMEAHAAAEDDPQTIAYAQELGTDFPTIAPKYLSALIRITTPSTSAAHELAKALVAKPKRQLKNTALIPQYMPVDASSIDGSTPQAPSVRVGSALSLTSPGNYAAARAQAFAQASAAHRKSKSDRFYGGVASYYAQVARDLGDFRDAATATTMNSLADRQSSATQLDLHGVDVRNAVRIAREKVEQWWESMGESRVNGRRGADDRTQGYNIVVGRGSHSEGGKSKLGPAVSKMLKQEGWRIQDEGAVICVRGKLK